MADSQLNVLPSLYCILLHLGQLFKTQLKHELLYIIYNDTIALGIYCLRKAAEFKKTDLPCSTFTAALFTTFGYISKCSLIHGGHRNCDTQKHSYYSSSEKGENWIISGTRLDRPSHSDKSVTKKNKLYSFPVTNGKRNLLMWQSRGNQGLIHSHEDPCRAE